MSTKRLALSAAVAATMAISVQAKAATITFSTPTQISGDSDIDTNGTFVRAYSFGTPNGDGSAPANTVVNNGSSVNVTFTPFTSSVSGTSLTSLTSPQGDTITTPDGGDHPGTVEDPSPALSDTNYQFLLGSGIFDAHGGYSMTLTLNSLNPGDSYQVELWANDSRSFGSGRTDLISDGVSTPTTVAEQPSNDRGDYTIGSFTADGTGTQEILVSSGTGFFVNAVELVDVTPTPEPGSLSLLCLGAVGLLARRRRAAR